MMKDNIYFVSGIGTDIGKTYATAFLAAKWRSEGINVITQKFIQTGCTAISEDILTHRRIMGMQLNEDDINQTTCGQMFSFPSSIHLAARLDKKEVELDTINTKTQYLANKYDRLLVEGAGGLMVPIREDFLTIDYVAQMNYKLVFVTNPFLGAINHSLLGFEAIKSRGIRLDTLVFNLFSREKGKDNQDLQEEKSRNRLIAEDSLDIISTYAKKMFANPNIITLNTL